MTDPRETPGFKGKRNEEKQVILLSAILDAVRALATPPAPPVAAPPAPEAAEVATPTRTTLRRSKD